ncbi:MAG: HDOD domain-containing protein [Bdellovibrionota bacterium]|nr:MAG: HDOD domain-containing protein [Bdellovibrionota bacterium]
MWKKLLGKKDKATEHSHEVPKGIVDAILATVGARAIPPMPGAAQKAFQLAVDPNAEARDFVEVIESDESLSARIVRIANSVYFDRGHGSKTIEQAVNVIGINELRCVLNANALSDLFPSRHPARNQLWAHDIATALIARQLAQRLLPGKAEMAFLGGLMHDIGKLLLLQRAEERYVKVLQQVEREGCLFHEAEVEQFVFDHTQVGSVIARSWNFTPELLEVIATHHRRDLSPHGLAGIVSGADVLSHGLALGHGKGMSKLAQRMKEQVPQYLNAFGIPEHEQRGQLDLMIRNFDSEYNLYAGKDGR